MNERILQKLEALKKKFAEPATPDTLSVIASWEKSIQDALLTNHLAEHEGFQPFLASVEKDVEDINYLLLNSDSKTLSDRDRDRLLDRRKFCESFLAFVRGAKDTLRSVEEEMDRNLKS